uniref:Uncharacterized protein n=1 Tax=Arundo donax TaxID=35708 RepID=A0A0A9EX48_ARUDO
MKKACTSTPQKEMHNSIIEARHQILEYNNIHRGKKTIMPELYSQIFFEKYKNSMKIMK